MSGCEHRLLGSDGTIEVNPEGVEADLRYRIVDSGDWETFEFERAVAIKRAIEHVSDSLETGDPTPDSDGE